MKIRLSFFCLISGALLAGCATITPMIVDLQRGVVLQQTNMIFSDDGVVVNNNTPYTLNILKFGACGLEATAYSMPPGGTFMFHSDFIPSNQTIVIVATAFYKGSLVGKASRTFCFSSYAGYSRIEDCTFNTYDFRMDHPPRKKSTVSSHQVMGPIERQAYKILDSGK